MWQYKKQLQYPVNIKKKDLKFAKEMFSQLGGPHGELSASLQYLSQRYTMPTDKGKALLTDIGTEELNHIEINSAIIKQLMEGATPEEIEAAGLGGFYAQNGTAIYPSDANGVPWTAAFIQATSDPIADLESDMAAEQRARATYEHLMNMTTDPDVLAPLSFLRQREIVHFQRFKELYDEYLEKGY